MILSDRTIREELEAGHIVIEPLGENCVQPSSVDLRLDRFFRVFLNHSYRVIDVKEDQEDLTELIEIKEDDAFILHPGEFVLGSTVELIGVPNYLVGRVEGKALAVDTPIPTPDGWRRMDELQVGEYVFSDTGVPIRIKDATEVLLGRPCYEVLFSDGSRIVADADHQWLTTTNADRRRGRPGALRTTAAIAESLRHGRERSHQVHLAGSVRYEPKELPIDPYTFGAWIGDGTSTSAAVTSADEEVLPGVLANAHIPRIYLEAGVQQRFALLEGLMDSGGHCDRRGRCQFTTVEEHLAEAVFELVASLGFRPVIAKRPALLDGVDHGPTYDVTFTPERPVFRLPRKALRQKAAGRLERSRAIVEARPVPSVPVRCIEVDTPTGIYLAGRAFIPTHNSSLGRLGLLIHSTAGFVDAGFQGHITLELSNVANLPITLYPGMKIGQISFLRMTTPADVPYGSKATGSKYQGQRGPTPSRYFENFRRP